MRLLTLTAMLATLTGCGEGMLRSGSSPAYLDGYNDGCANGSSRAGNLAAQVIRDEARYNAESDYAVGWANGNRECDGESFRANPNNTMEPIEIEAPR